MALMIGVGIFLAAVVVGLVGFTAITARRVEKAVPARGKFLELAGARIHYLDKGAGPPIVMVHGLGGQSGNFGYAVVERLAGEFRVIAMDRPGSGYSTRASDDAARLKAQSAFVAELIRKLGLGRPLLVGHSLGGAVALGVALDFPELVSGLALVAPLTQVPAQVPGPFRALEIESKLLRWLLAWTVATPVGVLRGPAIVKEIFRPEAVPGDFATKGGGLLGLRPGSFYNTSADLMGINEDLSEMVKRYGEIRVPVAILYGKSDAILNLGEHGEAMKGKIAGLRLELVEGGHMLPVTAAKVTAGFIRGEARRGFVGPGEARRGG
jgi:pimeloyl-ACP methyl ester carboxylesterase